MQDLLLPHNIDMMHSEKNVAELHCMDLFCTNLYGFVWTRLVLVIVDERNKTLLVYVYQMPVMLIRIHGIIIMIYMIFWGYHIRNNQKKNWFWHLCRVQKPWHTAKVPIFAVCKNHGTRQRPAVCRVPHRQGTRQTPPTSPLLEAIFFAVSRDLHTAKG